MIEIIVAITLAVLRISGSTSPTFQAIAHLFVGGLIGAWFIERKVLWLILATGLSIVEILCFIFMRG